MYKIKLMRKLKNTLLFLGLLVLGSCTKAEIPLVGENPLNRPVTYTQDIQPIIFNNCLTCHNSVNPRNGLILETYAQVRNSSEFGTLIARLNDAANPMPQSGLLTADRRALFDQWKSGGYLE